MAHSSLDSFVKTDKYETISHVILQCENTLIHSTSRNNHANRHASLALVVCNSSSIHHDRSSSQHDPTSSSSRPGQRRKLMTQEQLLEAKRNKSFLRCGNYGHWYSDHNEDWSVPANIPSSTTPMAGALVYASQTVEPKPVVPAAAENDNVNAVQFNMALDAALVPMSSFLDVGPMLNNGAPY